MPESASGEKLASDLIDEACAREPRVQCVVLVLHPDQPEICFIGARGLSQPLVAALLREQAGEIDQLERGGSGQ